MLITIPNYLYDIVAGSWGARRSLHVPVCFERSPTIPVTVDDLHALNKLKLAAAWAIYNVSKDFVGRPREKAAGRRADRIASESAAAQTRHDSERAALCRAAWQVKVLYRSLKRIHHMTQITQSITTAVKQVLYHSLLTDPAVHGVYSLDPKVRQNRPFENTPIRIHGFCRVKQAS